MSPAEELLRAAATLRERVAAFRAEAETNPYWELGYAVGTNNAMGGAGGELAATFTPELAEGLAPLLDQLAVVAGRAQAGSKIYAVEFALVVARQINGTPPGSIAEEGIA